MCNGSKEVDARDGGVVEDHQILFELARCNCDGRYDRNRSSGNPERSEQCEERGWLADQLEWGEDDGEDPGRGEGGGEEEQEQHHP